MNWRPLNPGVALRLPLPFQWIVGIASTVVFLLSGCDLSADDASVRVVRMSTFPDTSALPRWDASSNDDLYTLSFVYYGDKRDPAYLGERDIRGVSEGELHKLRLRDIGSDLPEYAGFERTVARDYEGSYSPLRLGSLVDGEVRIHEWNPGNIITGQVSGKNAHGVSMNIYFYGRTE